jgi:hypothetical protein
MKIEAWKEQLLADISALREQRAAIPGMRIGDTAAASELAEAIRSFADELSQAEAEAAEFIAMLETAAPFNFREMAPLSRLAGLIIARHYENERAAKILADLKSDPSIKRIVQETSCDLMRDKKDKHPEILEAIIAVRGHNNPAEHRYGVADAKLDKINN